MTSRSYGGKGHVFCDDSIEVFVSKIFYVILMFVKSSHPEIVEGSLRLPDLESMAANKLLFQKAS